MSKRVVKVSNKATFWKGFNNLFIESPITTNNDIKDFNQTVLLKVNHRKVQKVSSEDCRELKF